MDKKEIFQQLNGLLAQELECAKSLLDILTNERSSLAKNPDELSRLTTAKQVKIGEMEQLNQQRNTLLKKANFETQQVEKCIHWCTSNGSLSNSQQLVDKWGSLLTAIDKCRQYNQTNGTIIDSSSRRIRQMLAILHGQKPEKIAYNASGKTIDSGGHRTIAKA